MDDTLNLGHTFGSIKRDGQWEVPADVALRQRMGSASLDFTNAIFGAPQTNLEIDMVGGSVEIRVPTDMRVIAGLRTTLASYEDHRREDNSMQTGLTLTISGRAVWGSVEVRGPRR
jgi:predicted membrane protein